MENGHSATPSAGNAPTTLTSVNRKDGNILKYLILFLSLLSVCSAQTDHHYFFNPGVKLGYVFGADGGFIFGVEGSLIMTGDYNDDPMIGLVANYDWFGKTEFFHVGLEYSENASGIEFGPTFAWREGVQYTGAGLTAFAGILLYPYYNYTFLKDGPDYHQIGAFAKLPLQIDDGVYSWFKSRPQKN